MKTLEWNEFYSVGVKSLDEQHMNLFFLINKMRALVTSPEQSVEIGNLLTELEKYVHEHFLTEEGLLEKYNYYGLDQQKKEHQLYEQKVLEYQARLDNAEEIILLDMIGFLVDWWTGHIQGTDSEYRFFLNNRGVY
jgi:hemerythrin